MIQSNKLLNVLSFIMLLLFSSLDFAQSQNIHENEIFHEIILHEIFNDYSPNGTYITCDKFLTHFNVEDFENESSLNVPKDVLIEIEKASEQRLNSTWDQEVFNKLDYISEHLKSDACISMDRLNEIFEKTQQRQSAISVGQPVCDLKRENCVVLVTRPSFIGSVFGYSYFVKNIYGKWVIIDKFDIWMS